ncbi:MAG: tetratricopeptide (TPR) repeat protein, partial [Planctomycetota bacterium]
GEIESSLKFYRRLLATSPNDPSLVTKVGNIEEELGRAPAALEMYRRALSMIIAHKPQFVTRLQDNKDTEDPMAYYRGGNVDEETALYQKLMRSLQVNLKDRGAAAQMLSELGDDIGHELDSLAPAEGERILADHPRLEILTQTSREIALSFGLLTTAAQHDGMVLDTFSSDREATLDAVKARRTRGYLRSAELLVKNSPFAKDGALQSASGSSTSIDKGEISIAAASSRLVDLLGRPDAEIKSFLDRVDTGSLTKSDIDAIPSVLSACIISNNKEAGERILRAGLRKVKPTSASDPSLSVLIGLAKRLDLRMARAIFIEQAEARLVEEPRSYYEIMQIEEALGGDLFDSETAARILRNSAKNADKDLGFGAVELIGSVDKAERPSILRDLYQAYPASKKAVLLSQAVFYMEAPLEESFEDWYANSLKNDLKTGDTMQVRLSSGFRQSTLKPSYSLLLKVARVIEENKPSVENIGIQVSALVHLEREEEALTMFDENLIQFVGTDYQARRARDQVVHAFLGRDQGKLLSIIETSLAEDPGQAALSKMRWDLMKKVPDYGERLQVELEKNPKDATVLEALVNHHSILGHRVELAETLQALAAVQPENKRWSLRLEGTLKSLHHPLSVQKPKLDPKKDEKDKKKKSTTAVTGMATMMTALTIGGGGAIMIPSIAIGSVGSVSVAGAPGSPEREIQDLIKAKKLKEAQSKLRAHWRGFRMQGVSPFRAKFPGNLILRYRSAVYRQTPGMLTIFGALKKDTPEFVAEEARLLLRILAGENDPSVPGIRAELLEVIAGAIPKEQRKAEQDRLVKLAKSNQANIDDLELLLRMAANDTGEVSPLIVDLAKRPEIPNSGRLKLLAGVLARAGNLDQAGRLYRLEVLAGSGDDGFSINNSKTVSAMIGIIEKTLGKKADDYILDLVDDKVMSASGYNAANLAQQAIGIWQKRLSPQEAMARVKAVLPILNSRYMGRSTQRNALPVIFARCGSFEIALKEVEGTLCSSEEDAMRLGGYVRTIPKQTAEALVTAEGEWKDHFAWTKMLAEKAIAWHGEGRLLSPTTVFGVLAAALHADGHTDQSETCLELAKSNARGGRGLSLLAEISRKIGKVAEADQIEEKLLVQRRLAPKKIKDVIERIFERDVNAGFAAGEAATKYTLEPGLLELLIAQYDAAKNVERVKHWRGLLELVKPTKKKDSKPLPPEETPEK